MGVTAVLYSVLRYSIFIRVLPGLFCVPGRKHFFSTFHLFFPDGFLVP